MTGDAGAARPLLIFPCNGNALEAADCLGDAWRLVAFIDDTASLHGTDRHGRRVGPRRLLQEHPDARVLAVHGSPHSYLHRREITLGLGVDPGRWATVIHPRACVSPQAVLGRNVTVMAGACVAAGAVIGDHVCLLPNAVVHHDARIGDWSLVGSNVTVAGHTVVGRNCYIASGSSLMNGISIGDGALVGLASCVLRDVLPGRRLAGHPGRYVD
jgi:sugar O-acyltransferase (sialic acid O-acetyltransferase NeuD family)